MLARATLLVLLAAGCRRERPPPPSPEVHSCLDQQLAARGLNAFGDPADTAYPGGTPLFDEKTGQSTDRAAYVFSRRPDIRKACAKRP